MFQRTRWKASQSSNCSSLRRLQRFPSGTGRDVSCGNILIKINHATIILLGCDNFYNGAILPCLLRPWLPPYSYSTTEADNGEYRRRRSERKWRTV